MQQHRRRALEPRVGRDHATRDRRDLEHAERGAAGRHQTKRNASLSVQRRSRVKLTRGGQPSPVGRAMVKLTCSPRRRGRGRRSDASFLTKMQLLMARAIADMSSMFVECIDAVWPKAVLDRAAPRRWPSATVAHAEQRDHRHQQLVLHEGVLLVDLAHHQPQSWPGRRCRSASRSARRPCRPTLLLTWSPSSTTFSSWPWPDARRATAPAGA